MKIIDKKINIGDSVKLIDYEKLIAIYKSIDRMSIIPSRYFAGKTFVVTEIRDNNQREVFKGLDKCDKKFIIGEEYIFLLEFEIEKIY